MGLLICCGCSLQFRKLYCLFQFWKFCLNCFSSILFAFWILCTMLSENEVSLLFVCVCVFVCFCFCFFLSIIWLILLRKGVLYRVMLIVLINHLQYFWQGYWNFLCSAGLPAQLWHMYAALWERASDRRFISLYIWVQCFFLPLFNELVCH